ncbi:L,D-transpeptidase [Bartonella sp. W8098]|nr:L,D-transpeptidase [Bartonella apis]MBI0169328.1 L,D-transpeptidase [Bartonella sp. W8167]MBI0172223.1 L,D-transpeptidase [Bartonella sp. W8151]MBI0174684.1 L,D-transpeptidase [Bartonella apis]MBI0176318.1 L,D-transpeptidase [Bartonella apis]
MYWKLSSVLIEALFFSFSAMNLASADNLLALVNVSDQTMTVKKNGKTLYHWKVSTGRKGYATPSGTFRPVRMHKMWRSRKYDNAPMPYAIFYNEGYAIHGTSYVSRLGSPASHGCVRLNTANAQILYKMLQEEGLGNLKIVIK